MKSRIFIFIFFAFLSTNSFGQTFNGTGGYIADDNTLSDYTIDVQGLMPESLTPDHGLTRVCINLTHTWVSDLDIRLITPDGTNIMLSATKGDDLDNYTNTCFDMSAAEHINNAGAPFTGDYKPYSSLGNANNGSSGNGVWTLRIFDQFAFADTGEMLDWSLSFGESAPEPFKFDSSSFPIFILSTDNVTIPNEPKVPGTIKIIDNGAGNFNHLSDSAAFESFMGIEVRGASSQSFPKKSFGFETQDEFGDDLEVALLGLAKEEDWILYAPYTDKSMIRDALTYQLGRETGAYAPHTIFVELFLNKDYHGIYCLEEKIKRDKNRVNITKLNPADTIGDPLTGGYILKVDRDDGPGTYFVSQYEGTDTTSEVRIVLEDPEGEDLHPKQISYIENFVADFENALYSDHFTDPTQGYRKYIDVDSWVDFFLISELGHNVDAYRLSTFMYKDRDSKDSLLHMGPLWDFNLAYGNVNYCSSENIFGWAYEDSGWCGNTPLWWARLQQDSSFQNAVKCRFTELRENELSTSNVFHNIDSMALHFAGIENRNYERWPILGEYVWPNFFIGQTYEEEINFLKQWVNARLEWMENNLPGNCLISGIEETTNVDVTIAPNPVHHSFTLKSGSITDLSGKVTIINAAGVVCFQNRVSAGEEINVSHLINGTYFVNVELEDGRVVREKMVVLK